MKKWLAKWLFRIDTICVPFQATMPNAKQNGYIAHLRNVPELPSVIRKNSPLLPKGKLK